MLQLHVFITRELVEAGDRQVGFEEPVAGAGRLKLVVGENLEGQMEATLKFVLPLFGEAAGVENQAAAQVTTGDQLLDEQPRHDGFVGAGVIG
jgi:hypothetical protein